MKKTCSAGLFLLFFGSKKDIIVIMITPRYFKSAFTLIEVLVVISIMGILTAVVYSSFSGAKTQSKDQQKVTDASAIQLALEVYFNQNHQYPNALTTLVPVYMPGIPTSGTYNYFPITNVAPNSPICTSYHLSVMLEKSNSYLESKKGFDSTNTSVNQCFGGTGTRVNAATIPLLYDVTP